MNFLFIHQNFPSQFLHLAIALARSANHEVVALGDAASVNPDSPIHPNLRTFAYKSPEHDSHPGHAYLGEFEAQIRRGQQVIRAAHQLRGRGFEPEIIVYHSGWGEGLFLRQLFPRARLINYCEFYYRGHGADFDFDPEFPPDLDGLCRLKIRNSPILLNLLDCDVAITPTEWQRKLFPEAVRSGIQVAHEGIDTDLVRPDAEAAIQVDGISVDRSQQVITFAARSLEPYRGFHRFMRSLPALQELLPDARFIVLGKEQVSYGRQAPGGQTYKKLYLTELGERVDWSRVHFFGLLPYREYLKVLQISTVHLYLTYPFILSWSMLEAMACCCTVIGSATPPVQEVLEHEHNGLLVNFFSENELIEAVTRAATDRPLRQRLSAAARETIVTRYDLNSVCLPRWRQLVET